MSDKYNKANLRVGFVNYNCLNRFKMGKIKSS